VNFKELEWELSVSAAANPVDIGNLVSGQLLNEVAGSKLRSAGEWIEKKCIINLSQNSRLMESIAVPAQ